MKVIQIIPQFGLAGAETMCENLTCELKEKNTDVVVVSLYNYQSAITERIKSRGIPIYYLDKKIGFDFTIFPKLIKVLKKEKADVIHTHLYAIKYAVPAAVLSGVKVRIHTVHNIAKKECRTYARYINRFFYKHLNVIPVALSKKIQDSIIDEYGLDRKNIPIVYNGIDLSKCIPKIDYEIKDTINILHIGRFSEQKNHAGLIQAFNNFHEKIKNSRLFLIGDGELRQAAETMVEEYGLQDAVVFLGLQSNVYRFLHEADIFILASKYEGMPMVLIEAMGTGLPIVTTAVGGIPDMIEDGKEGLLVDWEEDDIGEALLKLLENENMRIILGKNARENAIRNFSAPKMCNEYYLIYRSLIIGD